MANICLYKIKVNGSKKACYALINMMPLYSGDKYIIREEGSDDDYTSVFTGDCKWSVDSYTKYVDGLMPYTKEELDKIEDGDGWNYPLINKSLLLDCDIYCNSKDIDDYCYAIYSHYNRGIEINDECPKELHIKRGRDYDTYLSEDELERENNLVLYDACEVRFSDNRSYLYLGKYNIGDLVYVDGNREGCLGQVKKLDQILISVNNSYKNIVEFVCNVDLFKNEDVELIWTSFSKPKDRKIYLKSIGLEESVTKKKFLTLMENKWIEFAQKDNNWENFLEFIKQS